MAYHPQQTLESQVLNHYPEIRDAVEQAPDFHAWKDGLPAVTIDEATYYVRGGDMLKDEDQVIFEWARRNGLLSDEALVAATQPQSNEANEVDAETTSRRRSRKSARAVQSRNEVK